jgi:chromosomal replication initiation ATPase DnaA
MLAPKISRPAVIEAIVAEVCAEHGMEPREVLSRSLKHTLIPIRQEIWWRVRCLRKNGAPRFSFPQMGRWFDRDHTTIRDGVIAHEGRRRETICADNDNAVGT